MKSFYKFLALASAFIAEVHAGIQDAPRLSSRKSHTRYVQPGPGTPIQDAIDHASQGDTIIVKAGTYAERLLIKKSGLTLIGQGATIVPPTTSTDPNDCSGWTGDGSEAGICIAGKGIHADGFRFEHRKVRSVDKPIQNVVVQGFSIEGFGSFFSGTSLMIIGAKDVQIKKNTIRAGFLSNYGYLSAGSRSVVMADNIITSLPNPDGSDPTPFAIIAACNDNFAGTDVYGNTLHGFVVGFCIQTDNSWFRKNQVDLTCFGAFVDPFVSGVTITDNEFTNSYENCSESGAFGVFIDGSRNSKVKGNTIKGIKNIGGFAAGISITDDHCQGPQPSLACDINGNQTSTASGNRVEKNFLSGNDRDLATNSDGPRNFFRKNSCVKSDPEGLCKKY